MTKAFIALGLVATGLAGSILGGGFLAAAVLFFGLLTCAFSDF